MHPTLLEVTEEFTVRNLSVSHYDSISDYNEAFDIPEIVSSGTSRYLQNMWERNTSTMKDYELFISAPFGNWIKHKNAISTTGTWTLHPRGNRFVSVMKSLRWNEDLQGWCNALGLPNPGIEIGLKKTSVNEVLSIAEVERKDFRKLYNLIPEDQSVELNLSCPSLGKSLPWDSTEVFARNKEKRKWCICKVSPVTSPEDLDFLITKLGFTQIHASNSLPIPNFGGLSGQTLIPYTLDIIRMIREEWPEVTVIAGGGVRDFGGVSKYLKEGANHVAIGSVCFNYFKMRKILKGKKEDAGK